MTCWCTCQSFASVYLCGVWFWPMLLLIKATFATRATLVLIFDLFYYGSQLFVHTVHEYDVVLLYHYRNEVPDLVCGFSRTHSWSSRGIIYQICFCKVFVKPVWCQLNHVCLWSCKKTSIHLYLHLFSSNENWSICCYSKHESSTLFSFSAGLHVVTHVFIALKPLKRKVLFTGKFEGLVINHVSSCFSIIIEKSFFLLQMFKYSMHNQKRLLLCCSGWLKLLSFRVSQVSLIWTPVNTVIYRCK